MYPGGKSNGQQLNNRLNSGGAAGAVMGGKLQFTGDVAESEVMKYTDGFSKDHEDEGDECPTPTACRLPMAMCCAAVLLFLGLLMSITTIPAGHMGVVDVFGSVRDQPLHPGLNFVNPFASIVKFSIQTQIIEMAENVPTKEGLTVHLEAAALIRIKPEETVNMYRTVGSDYTEKVVVPQFRSIIREVTSAHDAKDLYTSSARTQMTEALRKGLSELIASRGILVEETPLKKLELPQALQESIENKLQAEQLSQKMQFVLEKERQEATRKAIEADGISNFQRIVSGDINEGMLRWKGIEATETISRSHNQKVIIIGAPTANNLLPLLMGGGALDGDRHFGQSSSSSAKAGPSHATHNGNGGNPIRQRQFPPYDNQNQGQTPALKKP